MSDLYIEGVIYAEYQLAATTSSEGTIVPIDFNTDYPTQRVILEANGADITFCFGNASVNASTTVDGTSKLLPAGNFTIQDGAIFGTNLDNNQFIYGATIAAPRANPRRIYASVKTATGSGTAIIKLVRGI